MTVTPDLKCPENKGENCYFMVGCLLMKILGFFFTHPVQCVPVGCLLLVDLGGGRRCLGGSALAQCYKQLGDLCPDLDEPGVFSNAFNVTQKLIEGKCSSIILFTS